MPCLVVTGSIIDGRNILDRELVRRPQIGVTLFTLPMHEPKKAGPLIGGRHF
jgi:hypothetical protein